MIDRNNPRLTDFVLGELAAEQQAEIQAQIDRDPELATAVQELRRTVELIGDSYNSELKLELSATKKAELQQVGADKQVRALNPARSNYKNWYGFSALAVCISGLMIGSAIWYLNTSTSAPREVALADSPTDRHILSPVGKFGEAEHGKAGVTEEDFEPLFEMIQKTVKSDAWKDTGGAGEVEAIVPNLSLQVTQRQQIEGNTNPAGEIDDGRVNLNSLENFGQIVDETQMMKMRSQLAQADSPLRSHSLLPDMRETPMEINGRFAPMTSSGQSARSESYDTADFQNAYFEPLGTQDRREFFSGGKIPMEIASHNRRTSDFKVDVALALKQRGGGGGGRAAPSPAAVEVPLTESVPGSGDAPAASPALLDPAKVPARELVLSSETSQQFAKRLAERVDPTGTREIRIEQAGELDTLERKRTVNESLGTEIITLAADADDLQEVDKLVKQLAEQHGIEGKEQEKIQWRKQIQQVLDFRNAEIRKANTWKRVKAIPNATRLMIGEDDELEMSGMQVNVQVDGFRARVLIDCFFYNDRDQQLEGNFKLRLPDDASLYYFAFGESAYEYKPEFDWAKIEFQDEESEFVSLQPENIRQQREDDWKNCKEARMVPREKAAFAYNQTMRRKIDPALVEWSGAGVFNARVFPLTPKKMHRIVMGYDVNLVRTENGWSYQLDLPEQTGRCQVGLKVQEFKGMQTTIQPAALKSGVVQVELGSRQQAIGNDTAGQTRFTRYRFANPKTKSIRLSIERSSDIVLTDSDDQQGEFWGLQMTPELPTEAVVGNSRAIFLLDTSLSSNPDKFNVWLKLLRSTLENNRDSLTEFNVLFFDVGSVFWREGYVANTAENTNALLEDCEQISLEGATDLYGAIERISAAKWVYDEQANGPDLFLLSDGAVNWGETNLRLIQRQISDYKLGNLFAYQTGLTGTAIAKLRFLANQSGGAVFSVATEDEIKTASTAHRNRPWKLAAVSAAGTHDVLTAGRVEWVYPGQTLTIVGRGKPAGEVKLELKQGRQSKTVSVLPRAIASELASRLYGQVAVGQLESLGANAMDVAASYARHFRVTGSTCSLLMLETEAEYEQFGIKPQEDLFVIKSRNAGQLIDETLKQFANELGDPRAQMMAWLKRLESMPGMEFRIPTALKLALNEIQVEAISQPLDCDPREIHAAPADYFQELTNQELNYDVIAAESKRRARKSVDEAIKVLSCLIERNPGDLVTARDVAFTAMELDRPAQAYPLLLNVAKARPYEASVYPAIGQCLARLEQADMAIVFYEIALAAKFQNRGEDFRKIVAADYLHLLRQIAKGQQETSVPEFAKARQQTLQETLGFDSADLLITMMWNTDQTDVDLHISEPSGEVCSYQNKDTRIGGHITQDITTGFGPEMYTLPEAMKGKYDISVNLFGNGQNRTSLRNKVHLTIYESFGEPTEKATRKTIQLKTVGELETVSTVGIE